MGFKCKKNCGVCGKEFVAYNQNQKFCGYDCRNIAKIKTSQDYREKQKEQKKEKAERKSKKKKSAR